MDDYEDSAEYEDEAEYDAEYADVDSHSDDVGVEVEVDDDGRCAGDVR